MPLILLALADGHLGSASGLQRLFFMGYLLVLGTLGGMQFTLAMHYFGGTSAARAGGLYALDLVGAVMGAVLFGLFALPVMGLTISVLQLALLNLPPLVLLIHLHLCTSAQHL